MPGATAASTCPRTGGHLLSGHRPPEFPESLMAPFEQTESVADEPVVEEETLVEEVSIDGMCGVY
jgi:mycofactocin precursor